MHRGTRFADRAKKISRRRKNLRLLELPSGGLEPTRIAAQAHSAEAGASSRTLANQEDSAAHSNEASANAEEMPHDAFRVGRFPST